MKFYLVYVLVLGFLTEPVQEMLSVSSAHAGMTQQVQCYNLAQDSNYSASQKALGLYTSFARSAYTGQTVNPQIAGSQICV